jgi:hypothetical protein
MNNPNRNRNLILAAVLTLALVSMACGVNLQPAFYSNQNGTHPDSRYPGPHAQGTFGRRRA